MRGSSGSRMHGFSAVRLEKERGRGRGWLGKRICKIDVAGRGTMALFEKSGRVSRRRVCEEESTDTPKMTDSDQRSADGLLICVSCSTSTTGSTRAFYFSNDSNTTVGSLCASSLLRLHLVPWRTLVLQQLRLLALLLLRRLDRKRLGLVSAC